MCCLLNFSSYYEIVLNHIDILIIKLYFILGLHTQSHDIFHFKSPESGEKKATYQNAP